MKKDTVGRVKLLTSHLAGEIKDWGVGEEEQLRLRPLDGSVNKLCFADFSGGSGLLLGGSGGSGEGVGHRRSQGATKPLKACNGIL